MIENISWSIGIMLYNEKDTLAGVVTRTDQVLAALTSDYEIIIVDDCSSDGSAELADKLAARIPAVRVIHHPVNRGIGEVLYSAYQAAGKEWFNIIPADGEFIPDDLKRGYELLGPGRVVAYTHTKKMAWRRRAISLCQRFLNKALFRMKIRRPNWIKIMPLQPIREMEIITRSPAIETEIVVRLQRKGLEFVEIPSYNDIIKKKEGGMKIKMYIASIFTTFGDTIRLWWNLRGV